MSLIESLGQAKDAVLGHVAQTWSPLVANEQGSKWTAENLQKVACRIAHVALGIVLGAAVIVNGSVIVAKVPVLVFIGLAAAGTLAVFVALTPNLTKKWIDQVIAGAAMLQAKAAETRAYQSAKKVVESALAQLNRLKDAILARLPQQQPEVVVEVGGDGHQD